MKCAVSMTTEGDLCWRCGEPTPYRGLPCEPCEQEMDEEAP